MTLPILVTLMLPTNDKQSDISRGKVKFVRKTEIAKLLFMPPRPTNSLLIEPVKSPPVRGPYYYGSCVRSHN